MRTQGAPMMGNALFDTTILGVGMAGDGSHTSPVDVDRLLLQHIKSQQQADNAAHK